ncbi:ABC transporter permease [Peptoniphilus sp. KCTC 25270]|uniref:ABC transporter permease n=1 Tax=Peptoniphilus sp. KCTC 25270 TaxID=2897414 RepID=UPI001E2AEC0C|nr:ABC transporter permease [Peptoniphilus sp. KCTC 25270]MCD1146579.1 ABC transporter permease [Peptoniphilus sp. KCTC 25270]
MWTFLSETGIVNSYMLPSPIDVIKALIQDAPLLIEHGKVTLLEAFIGLFLGILLGFSMALLMEYFNPLYKAMYPVLVVTQTVPTVAIAPLLVLWFGYDIQAKIVLIVIATFFPITVGVLDGFKSVDPDMIKLFRSMGANPLQILWHGKLPHVKSYFFASLRISAAYAVVGAVIAEWLGGYSGLGVYMTRVRKSYAFDRMFAVILLISVLSVLLMKLVDWIQILSMPWIRKHRGD